MAQKPHAPRLRSAFHLQHHFFFELFEPRMSQIEGNSDGRASLRAKPFVAEITERLKGDSFSFELAVKVMDPGFELAAGDFDWQIANPRPQQLFVGHGKIRDRTLGWSAC